MFRKILNNKDRKESYAQCGEDLIIDFIFRALGYSQISYFDIGAYHPTHLSNTYIFYRRGCRGVCIEPNPVLYTQLRGKRWKDNCLNIGIGVSDNPNGNFYVMKTDTLSTFSKEEAERFRSYGRNIEDVIHVPIMTINDVMAQYLPHLPYFISLDVEGLEVAILETFDFSRFRPQVFCVETITYTEDRTEQKMTRVIELMNSNNYITYADTYINTIFVDREAWLRRNS
jgi:FkbM family methyltransferase